MKTINTIILKNDSKEEYLPNYTELFPHISSYVELDQYPGRYAPWHWHNTIELFYIESGSLEYYTPHGKQLFTAGSGGLINSEILHMTKLQPNTSNNIEFLHLFNPVLISGSKGNLIDQKYVTPLIRNSQIELLSLSPDVPKQREILKLLRESFFLEEDTNGYELLLREKLSQIWLSIIELYKNQIAQKSVEYKSNHQIKQMMLYIQEHYSEKISIKQLANVAFLSERECYRVFQECLHMTPVDYIRSHRLQVACQMLRESDMSLTQISQSCGLGSSSYFGKIFKENIGCTPLDYRRKWQNSDMYRQN